ncbi:MAG: RNA-binding domain-containing protein [Desulfurococcaceae archaeon]
MVNIVVEAEVRPTEDLEKVKKAILSVIKPESVEVEELGSGYRVVRARGSSIESLEPLRNMARAQQVEPAFRSYLYKYRRGGALTILLHKQAAFVGKLSLVDSDKESPLGPVRVEIEGTEEEIEKLIDYLAPEE